MRSLIIFAAIQGMAFFLGSSDTVTISVAVLGMASAVFVFAYLSAFKKDRLNKKNIAKAVFEVQ